MGHYGSWVDFKYGRVHTTAQINKKVDEALGLIKDEKETGIMSPSTLMAIATAVAAFLSARLAGLQFFTDNPDTLKFLTDGAQALILAALTVGVKFLGHSPTWEKLGRLLAAVYSVVRTEAVSGMTNNQLRDVAISQVLSMIPESKLGWRGLLLKVPGLNRWILGLLFDRLVSGYRRLYDLNPTASDVGAQELLRQVKLRNKVPAKGTI